MVIPAGPGATVHTSSLLRAKVPGIIRFAYASLVSLGVLAGLGLEALLLAHGHYSAFRPTVFSALAIVAGVIGGKAWYVAVHRGRKFDGWCIQGFVAGAAAVVAAAAFAGPGLPSGAYLGVAAPALLMLAVVLLTGLPRSGPVAVAGLAAYTLSRQFILGLRAEPRQWRYGRRVTAAAAVIALIMSAVLLARG